MTDTELKLAHGGNGCKEFGSSPFCYDIVGGIGLILSEGCAMDRSYDIGFSMGTSKRDHYSETPPSTTPKP